MRSEITDNFKDLSIIFDLDGTLVDSAESILSSINFAFKDNNMKPTQKLEKNLIGPPLRKTIEMITEEEDRNKIESIIASFKNHYDTIGFLETKAFAGIYDLLEKLYASKIEMYLVTNKRKKPTKKILDYLSLDQYFIESFSSDSFEESVKPKSEVLNILIDTKKLFDKRIVYIGDTNDDFIVTKDVNIQFIFAEWGYGTIIKNDNVILAAKPEKLFKIITENFISR